MARTKPRSELLKRWENLDRLVMPFEVKDADTDGRTFRGALSTSHLDLGNGYVRDVVHPGAFKRWISNFNKAADPYVPLLDSHDRWSIFNVFGHLTGVEERRTGKTLKLELEGGKVLELDEMFLDTEWRVIDGNDGDRVLDRLRPGSVRKMSMGYDAKRHDFGTLADGGKVRHLREVGVEEGSLVVAPMNPNAEVDIESVKGLLVELEGKDLDDADRAMLSELRADIDSILEGEEPKTEPSPEMISNLDQRIRALRISRLVAGL
jgi:HK97 family phage prohead protease